MMNLKLLVDARVIGGEGQGSATYIIGLYQAMMDHFGDQYDFFFMGYHPEAIYQKFAGRLKKDQIIQVKSRSKLYQLLYEFPKIIDVYNIDYAHFQYITPIVKNCKTIVTTHDILFNDFKEEFSLSYRLKRNFLFKRSLVRSEIRLSVSNYSRKAIAYHYGIPARTIHITPNAIDHRFLANYDKRQAIQQIEQKHQLKDYILFVSRIEPRKNHELLIKAYLQLALWKKGIPLVLIGNNTSNAPYLDLLLKDLPTNIRAHIHWIKYVEDEDLIAFYQAARLFIYPSKAEGFGIPPLEAAALKINTLCSNSTAMQDFSFFKENHFDPNDFGYFCRLLERNITHPPSMEELAFRARLIEQKYAWKNSAEVLHQQLMKSIGREFQPVQYAPRKEVFEKP